MLFIILVALSNLALLAEVKAVDISDTYYGTGAFNATSTGVQDSAFGYFALYNNASANFNTAIGAFALARNVTGTGNTATGDLALNSNNADNNTATGVAALRRNQIGAQNTAAGAFALQNSNANNNTADGYLALFGNTTGTQNTATGAFALKNSNGTNNTADGFQALLNNTGSNNIALGSNAGSSVTTGSNNIHIGAFGQAGDTNTIRIGKGGLQTRAFMQGIRGETTGQPNAVPVLVDSAGQLGTASSSRRFKHDIKPMDATSEAILALKPVTFHYKSDKSGTPQFGLIAEEVAEVNPDLVVRDDKGEIYTVRYDAVNAMLLNEFLKEHKKVEQQTHEIQEQKDTISDLKEGLATVIAQLKAQASQIQKVSSQLETSKPASKVVVNNQ